MSGHGTQMSYHTQEFEQAIKHLNNLTGLTINNINSAVAAALTNSKSANKLV